jgi:hypothetical protein
MDTIGLCVTTEQIGGFPNFNASNVSSLSPSIGRVTAANNVRKSLDVFKKHNISFEDILFFANPTE